MESTSSETEPIVIPITTKIPLPIQTPVLSSALVQSDPTVSVSKISVDNEANFYAIFTDGSAVRNLIEYSRLSSLEGVFRFTKDKILYEQGNSDNTLLNVVELKTYELTDYSFVSKSDEIVVGVNLTDLRNITRNVGKKDFLEFYKLANEPRNLYIRIKSQSEKGSESNLYLLPITNSSYTVYKLPEYQRDKKDPTVTVYQSDFSKLCKSLIAIKSSYVTIHGFKNGIIVKGILNTGAIGSVKEFGKCSVSPVQTNLKSMSMDGANIIRSKVAPPKLSVGEVGEVERYKMDIDIIKTLVKLNALSPTGTIKFYIEKNLPLKLTCAIGNMGKISVYIN
jgi:hypothetical protein